SLSADGRLNAEIAELSSPDFHLPQLTWFLGFVGVVLLMLTRRRTTLAPADLLLIVASVGATLFAQRFIVWAVLYLPLILPRALHHAWGTRASALQSSRHARALVAAAGLLLPLGVATLGARPAALGPVCQPLLPAIDAYAAGHRAQDRLLNDP